MKIIKLNHDKLIFINLLVWIGILFIGWLIKVDELPLRLQGLFGGIFITSITFGIYVPINRHVREPLRTIAFFTIILGQLIAAVMCFALFFGLIKL